MDGHSPSILKFTRVISILCGGWQNQDQIMDSFKDILHDMQTHHNRMEHVMTSPDLIGDLLEEGQSTCKAEDMNRALWLTAEYHYKLHPDVSLDQLCNSNMTD